MKLEKWELPCSEDALEVQNRLMAFSDFFNILHPADLWRIARYLNGVFQSSCTLQAIQLATGSSYYRPELWPREENWKTSSPIWALHFKLVTPAGTRLRAIQLRNPVIPAYGICIDHELVSNKTKAEINTLVRQLSLAARPKIVKG